MDLPALIDSCAPGVAPATLASIVRVESGGRAFAIGYHITRDGNTYRLTAQPKDHAQAVAWATKLIADGYRFDAGIAQVNSTNFSRLGLHPGNVFDACTNLRAAGAVLQEFYARSAKDLGDGQRALQAAISSYQTGSPVRGYQTGYVSKVLGSTLKSQGHEGGVRAPLSHSEAGSGEASLNSATSVPFGAQSTD